MSRLSASSPHVLRALSRNQTGKYVGSVKPFNFLISPHVAALGHPPGVDPQRFHLIAPYTRDARQWSKLRWTDVYSGKSYAISTREGVSGEGVARVQSYGAVVDRYRVHPEAKNLGLDGLPCGKRTGGYCSADRSGSASSYTSARRPIGCRRWSRDSCTTGTTSN